MMGSIGRLPEKDRRKMRREIASRYKNTFKALAKSEKKDRHKKDDGYFQEDD